jgi:hypothetical protein
MTDVDLEHLRLQLLKQLPDQVFWRVKDMRVAFDFRRAALPLKSVSASDVAGPFNDQWMHIHVFGERSVGDVDGPRSFLGILDSSGEVVGLDVDRDGAPLYRLNTRVNAFIDTFLAFDKGVRLTAPSTALLAAEAERIDPGTFRDSGWRRLADDLMGRG